MKLAPATHRPGHPACTNPVLMAISVEVGPGMRFAAPSMSRNCWRVTHCRLRTISLSISAIWAAGPPKLTAPSLRKREASSRSLGPSEARGKSSFVAPCSFKVGSLLPLTARTGNQQEQEAHQHGKVGAGIADHEPEAGMSQLRDFGGYDG